MNELISIIMFVGLAFGMSLAALIVQGFRALYLNREANKLNRMPERIRSMNG